MNSPLVVYLDGAPRLEAARGANVPGQLRALYARLDADMDAGVELDGAWVAAPDDHQRCVFVLERLLHALMDGRTEFAQTLLIYLAILWPELRAIRVRRTPDGWGVELDES